MTRIRPRSERTIWRHKERYDGSYDYEVIGTARLISNRSAKGVVLVLYRHVEGGDVVAKPAAEFFRLYRRLGST